MQNITFNPRNFILEITKQHVKPALGCTEVGAVTLAAAKAAKILPSDVVSAKLKVSTNIYRNDARVGVPNLGICGIHTIAAAGFILKNPEKKLECISDVNKSNISKIYKLKATKKIIVDIDYNAQPVYVYVKAIDKKNNVAEVLIEEMHDNFVFAKLNGKETLTSKDKKSTIASCGLNFDEHVDDLPLSVVFDCCKRFTKDDLSFLIPTIKMNEKISNYGLKHCKKNWITYGLAEIWKQNLANYAHISIIDKINLNVCAAVEARMYGCNLPVATSDNSGDHGLLVSIPIDTYAKSMNLSTLETLQALIFAHYITWYIKSHIGHLCAMCGCAVAAGPGAICGIAFLKKWDWPQINDLLNATLCSQINILCDGAKSSCAYKCINALANGYLALKIVGQKKFIQNYDGIVHENAEKTIQNYKLISEKTLKSTTNVTVEMLDRMQKNFENK